MIKGTPIDWLSNQASRAVIGAVRLLPYAKRVPFMGAVMRKVLGVFSDFASGRKPTLR